MFTLQQIKEAHARVKSGADFPSYVQELIRIGITRYTAYVADGKTVYSGNENDALASEPRYETKDIAAQVDPELFIQRLKMHQQGQTDFLAFCSDCAATGIHHWVVDPGKLTCTYYAVDGKEILEEKIPS